MSFLPNTWLLGRSGKGCKYKCLKEACFLSSKDMACHFPGVGIQGAVRLWAESRRQAEHKARGWREGKGLGLGRLGQLTTAGPMASSQTC